MSSLPKLDSLSEALSVAGVTYYIQALLEQDPQLHRLWIVGEVSSASDRGGHIFFTLKEPDGSAALQAVVWRSRRFQLATLPAPGMQVFLLGQIRLYPQRGQYQISVFQVLPAGAGLQALRRQQLQQRLTAEGVFDPAFKQPLPPYPSCIAVVTSPQAAAWGDIQQTLRSRQPGLQVLLSPAIVQGKQAPAAIAAALERVANDHRAELVILARGGGAREDLDCFDDERVVRAISTCPVPVITGIGHERDETLADLAADHCAHTPTAAAEQAVPALVELQMDHQGRVQALWETVQSALQQEQQQVASVRRRLQQLRLDQRIHQHQQHLDSLKQRLQQAAYYRLTVARQRCQHLHQTLQTLDPEAVLKRGYAVVRAEGDRVVDVAESVSVGEMIHIQLAQGAIVAQVLACSGHPPTQEKAARE